MATSEQSASCRITIGEVEWTPEQIERLEYERNLHMLHKLATFGAEVRHEGRVLTDSEIDYLSARDAWHVSIETRLRYRDQDAIDLLRADFKLSDDLWKRLGFSLDAPMKVSRCNLSVTGLTLQQFMGMMREMQTNDRIGLAAHPEHFLCHVSFDDGKIVGIEPFGMYGTPTLVTVHMRDAAQLGERIQQDVLPDFPISMAGDAYLDDGVTGVNVPFHQFKPTANGFEARTAVYWPEDTPDEIVDGHSLHLAMEFYEGFMIASGQGMADVR